MLNKNNKALYIEGIDGLKQDLQIAQGIVLRVQQNKVILYYYSCYGTKGKTKRFTETNKLMSYAFGLVN